ncbi:hypothetical protein, partial [Polynucleobacter sp.]|uniref:hypothetical protein n=1 Tax=Polynucleobacter sp. TaxID=2029855 RepID=UPI0037C90510
SAGQYLSAGQIGAAASNFAHLNNQSSLGPVIDQARTSAANLADSGSTALGVASIWSPPPIDVLAAGGALALKGTSYFLAPPSNSQIGYDIFSSAIPVFSPQTKGIQTGIAIGTAILQPVIVPQLEGNGKK